MSVTWAAKRIAVCEIAAGVGNTTPMGCKLHSDTGNAILSLSPSCRSSERLGTSTRKDLHVLCYQHHNGMLPRLRGEPAEGMLYACQQSGCLIRYDSQNGYFLKTDDAKTIEQEITPRVTCSIDGQLMYLAE